MDVLRQALDAAGVELIAGDRVRELRRAGSGYSVTTESGDKRSFDAVVVACGGLAGEKLGGGRDGYELLKALGHTRTALRRTRASTVGVKGISGTSSVSSASSSV